MGLSCSLVARLVLLSILLGQSVDEQKEGESLQFKGRYPNIWKRALDANLIFDKCKLDIQLIAQAIVWQL
jgi:hypothetical protein